MADVFPGWVVQKAAMFRYYHLKDIPDNEIWGKEGTMEGTENPALVALSRVLEDASRIEGTPPEDILVQLLEFRSRTEDPSPLPPAFHIQLGSGLEYWADTQGNISRMGRDATDTEIRVRFTQSGGIGGWTSEYEAEESTLSASDVTELRQHITDTDFFNLPALVGNGERTPDLFSYTVWIAVGRNNRAVKTYDGSGPHKSPPLEKLIAWLKHRAPEPGPKPQSRA